MRAADVRVLRGADEIWVLDTQEEFRMSGTMPPEDDLMAEFDGEDDFFSIPLPDFATGTSNLNAVRAERPSGWRRGGSSCANGWRALGKCAVCDGQPPDVRQVWIELWMQLTTRGGFVDTIVFDCTFENTVAYRLVRRRALRPLGLCVG